MILPKRQLVSEEYLIHTSYHSSYPGLSAQHLAKRSTSNTKSRTTAVEKKRRRTECRAPSHSFNN